MGSTLEEEHSKRSGFVRDHHDHHKGNLILHYNMPMPMAMGTHHDHGTTLMPPNARNFLGFDQFSMMPLNFPGGDHYGGRFLPRAIAAGSGGQPGLGPMTRMVREESTQLVDHDYQKKGIIQNNNSSSGGGGVIVHRNIGGVTAGSRASCDGDQGNDVNSELKRSVAEWAAKEEEEGGKGNVAEWSYDEMEAQWYPYWVYNEGGDVVVSEDGEEVVWEWDDIWGVMGTNQISNKSP